MDGPVFWILRIWGGPPAAGGGIVNPYTVPWLTISENWENNFQEWNTSVMAPSLKKNMLYTTYYRIIGPGSGQNMVNYSQNIHLANSLHNLLLYYINHIDII